ncbi:MAG: hypothetical protein FWH21_08955 [Kiritimatiellaeota bacterium]|nr:hypothetical protein [Kiritimatiellota bacterium]
MKKRYTIITMLAGIAPLLFADTNALIEVKVFKDWIIDGECNFGNFVIKNTGTDPLPLAKRALDFESGQLTIFASEHESLQEREGWFKGMGGGLFLLPSEETHVYEGRTFFIENRDGKLYFKMPVYFGNGVWIDSEPVTFNRVVPDSVEPVVTLTDINGSHDLFAVTYKSERWLYKKSVTSNNRYPVCPLSLTNKIRVEPHDGTRLYKIWDGDKSMILQKGTSLILEGPDENNVFGKWTRERKQQAEADNAEVRRKKQEAQ